MNQTGYLPIHKDSGQFPTEKQRYPFCYRVSSHLFKNQHITSMDFIQPHIFRKHIIDRAKCSTYIPIGSFAAFSGKLPIERKPHPHNLSVIMHLMDSAIHNGIRFISILFQFLDGCHIISACGREASPKFQGERSLKAHIFTHILSFWKAASTSHPFCF